MTLKSVYNNLNSYRLKSAAAGAVRSAAGGDAASKSAGVKPASFSL